MRIRVWGESGKNPHGKDIYSLRLGTPRGAWEGIAPRSGRHGDGEFQKLARGARAEVSAARLVKMFPLFDNLG